MPISIWQTLPSALMLTANIRSFSYWNQFLSRYICWETWGRQCSDVTTARPHGQLMASHRKFHKSSRMHMLVLAQWGEASQKHLQGQGWQQRIIQHEKAIVPRSSTTSTQFIPPPDGKQNCMTTSSTNTSSFISFISKISEYISLVPSHVHIFIFTLHFFQTNFCC